MGIIPFLPDRNTGTRSRIDTIFSAEECLGILVEAGGVARLSLGQPGHRLWRRGEGLPGSRASPSSSLPARRPSPVRLPPPVGKRWMNRRRLVEAGGVEPPSEDSLLRATTCVSGHLGLVPGDPGRQGSLRTIPGEISPFGPPGGGFGLSRDGDPLAPIRAFDGRGQAA